MDIGEIIRAWRDGDYCASLSDEQRALMPDHPLGEPLSEEEFSTILGDFCISPGTVHLATYSSVDTLDRTSRGKREHFHRCSMHCFRAPLVRYGAE